MVHRDVLLRGPDLARLRLAAERLSSAADELRRASEGPLTFRQASRLVEEAEEAAYRVRLVVNSLRFVVGCRDVVLRSASESR